MRATTLGTWLRASTCVLAVAAFAVEAQAQSPSPSPRNAQAQPKAPPHPAPECNDNTHPDGRCPDLIVNIDDSRPFVDFMPSCRAQDPLVSGYIAIKNIGDRVADITQQSTGALSQIAGQIGVTPPQTEENWVEIYNPYNKHLIAVNENDNTFLFQTDEMDPLDQEGFRFSLAAGVRKDLLNYGPPDLSSGTRQALTGRDEIRLIQYALNEHPTRNDRPEITVDGAYGETTRRAIIEFQESIFAEATGILTRNQRDLLFDDIFENEGAKTKVCVDIYAVVDPENKVKESNEANNIAAWRVEIDCSAPALLRRGGRVPLKITSSQSYSYRACPRRKTY